MDESTVGMDRFIHRGVDGQTHGWPCGGTDRQIARRTQIQKDMQTGVNIQTDRQIDRQTCRWITIKRDASLDVQTDRQTCRRVTDRQDRQIDRQTCRRIAIKTDRQIDRRSDRSTGADRQTDGQTDGPTVALQPFLQGLGDVKSQPLVLVGEEA